jgi:hypothetical protein
MFTGLSSRIAAASRGRAIPSRGIAWRTAFFAAALGISACSTNNVLSLRPDVDVGTTEALPAGGGGMQDLVPDDPYLQQADAAQQPEEPVALSGPAPSDPMMSEPADMGEAPPGETGNFDDPAESAPADEMGGPYTMGAPAEPEAVQGEAEVAMSVPPPASEPRRARPVPEPEGNHGVVLAGYPRLDEPAISGPPPMPADELACRRELKSLGVVFRELSPIHDGASCNIDHPVKVSGLPGDVALKPAATLNCEMALTFAKWTKNELNPAARRRYWSRVKTIHQMSSYSCRRINGSHKMSEHSTGNALDVGRIELSNGKDIDVEKPGLFAFRTRGFLNSVRTDGCEYFTTVLGPGYNWDHRNHFHFDIKPRRNGRHACH